MPGGQDGVVDAEVLASLHQLYGVQSQWIDGGHAVQWAETFTDDGEFRSPSYPGAVVGRAELTAFAERFHADSRAAGEVRRHVITNLYAESTGAATLRVSAYLQLITTSAGGSPRVLRITTITDEVVRLDGQWRIRRRVVARDDEESA